VAGVSGQFIGLVLGGLLGPVGWHLVFVVSVPFGISGTVWAYPMLRDLGERRPAGLDWRGNVTFALGLDFAHWQFALIMLLNEIGMGLFTSPNLTGVMNNLPPGQRGAGAGMTQTFQDSGTVLSIGIFFTLIITGAGGVASCSSAARADRAWGARDRCGASGISEFLRSSRCGLARTCLPATSATTPSSRREDRVRICRSGQSWPVAAMQRRDPGPRVSAA
jgi:hypothetical protein